jgi:hypothetical protein
MMSKVDTRGMSPFYQWWHKNCDAMIDDDWSAEEMAGAAWNEAQAQLTTLQQRADVAEGLARALEELRKAIGSVPYANEYEPAYTSMLNADAALAAFKQAGGK